MKYTHFFIILVVLAATSAKSDTDCDSHWFICRSPNIFVTCINRDGRNEVENAMPQQCPMHTSCQAGASHPCMPNTVSKFGNTIVHDDQHTCIYSTKTPASQCNKYYVCEDIFRSFQLKQVLHTCLPGLGFDAKKLKCVAADETTCAPAIKEAEEMDQISENTRNCPHSGNFPINTYNKCSRLYYECGMFSKKMSLTICPEGEIFNLQYKTCRTDDDCY